MPRKAGLRSDSFIIVKEAGAGPYGDVVFDLDYDTKLWRMGDGTEFVIHMHAPDFGFGTCPANIVEQGIGNSIETQKRQAKEQGLGWEVNDAQRWWENAQASCIGDLPPPAEGDIPPHAYGRKELLQVAPFRYATKPLCGDKRIYFWKHKPEIARKAELWVAYNTSRLGFLAKVFEMCANGGKPADIARLERSPEGLNPKWPDPAWGFDKGKERRFDIY